MNRKRSILAYEDALRYIPGGVNSPVRALKSVGETPLFIKKANKETLTDIEGNRFTDFCMSWGTGILGHAFPTVVQAAKHAVAMGSSYGIPTLRETELARLIVDKMESIRKVRFVNSGTEAVMSAIRLARGFTGRDVIVKFDGCYHGHADHLLVSAGSGAATLGASSSAGVPGAFVSCTVSLPYNDAEAVDELFKTRGREIAAIIVEPVAANMGVVLPEKDFLQHLRDVSAEYGALLIFDEVITGFRLNVGGAQQLYCVTPDLTTLGKIVGGGYPAAAFGGRDDIMALLAPDGPVYQAGTLSGNPVAMAAGIATMNELFSVNYHTKLNARADKFNAALKAIVYDQDVTVNHTGSMFTIFFSAYKVRSFADAKLCNQERFGRFFRYMLAHNIYISPSQFEANFISSAHSKRELSRFLNTVKDFFKSETQHNTNI
ncbi:MAG: glutamate-1-semialdehyde 2,1-aminomutase [Tannerella sp.]|jgi:glutamate-1-semialdehyde 2,1-aminomutase|nr:glutamate-1-semialdehyde 2,1-aminomutase [Tannerella sp.]